MWWIGDREPDPRMIEHVRFHVARAFACPVELRRGPERPAEAFDARRGQHHSTRILKWLAAAAPPETKVLGITDVDLFIPILTFVFGEAQLGGPAALVSSARLAEPPQVADGRLVAERLAKESVHELGHAFGLMHCGTPGCVMGRSPSVRHVDTKGGELCRDCRTRLSERARPR